MSTLLNKISAANFGCVFGQLISPRKLQAVVRTYRRSPAGVRPRVRPYDLILGMVFHALLPWGLLSTHIEQVSGKRLCDSSVSQRRQGMGWELFVELLDSILAWVGVEKTHPHAFYKGLRIVGIDGSTWSVSNTPPIKASSKKARSRRRRAAFFRLSMTAIYELGMHNPLAARIGLKGESEMALATGLLPSIKAGWLLLADRYYGFGKFVFLLLALESKPSFILRVRKNIKSNPIERLSDGSCLIRIHNPVTGEYVIVREIHARVYRRPGHWISVRLWTNLLNPKHHPAKELVRLYALRWDQELAYKELKIHLRRSPLLLSHTVVTAAQEIVCLLIAQALIARVRMTAAQSGHPSSVLEISFSNTLNVFRSLWFFTALFEAILPQDILPKLVSRALDVLADHPSRARRHRSCPRAVRQPIGPWPRLLRNASSTGAFQYEICRK
jgi:hypothetical protein